jgi:hypothetical protein
VPSLGSTDPGGRVLKWATDVGAGLGVGVEGDPLGMPVPPPLVVHEASITQPLSAASTLFLLTRRDRTSDAAKPFRGTSGRATP